jgi:lysozyme
MRPTTLALLLALVATPAAFGQEAGLPLPHAVSTAVHSSPGQSVVRGVDVSSDQGKINWPRAASAGIKFAFIRASDGFYHDKRFAENMAGAKAAGVLRGSYQYFRASRDGAEQAKDFLKILGDDVGDFAPTADVETNDGVSAKKLATELTKWVQVVSAATGRTPIIYTAPGLWSGWRMPAKFGAEPLWVAHWTKAKQPHLPTGWTQWTFWQYNAYGHVPGIGSGVDLDYFHGTIDELKVFAASSAPPIASAPAETPGFSESVSGDTPAGPALNDLPVLSHGDTGQNVRLLQQLLRASGANVAVDGTFGTETEKAVRAFQTEHDQVANGIVTIQTWRALQQ